MNRGEIFYANLGPTVGSEIKKKRPVVIVSRDANNHKASTVTILPITLNIAEVHPFEVLLTSENCGLNKMCKAQAQQIRTIAKERIKGKKIGAVDEETIQQIDAAIRLHLNI